MSQWLHCFVAVVVDLCFGLVCPLFLFLFLIKFNVTLWSALNALNSAGHISRLCSHSVYFHYTSNFALVKWPLEYESSFKGTLCLFGHIPYQLSTMSYIQKGCCSATLHKKSPVRRYTNLYPHNNYNLIIVFWESLKRVYIK